MTSEPTWDILILSVPHRSNSLALLLRHLQPQVSQHNVGVRVFPGLEHTIPEKMSGLLESSSAEYVSFIDDDDTVSSDYCEQIRAALRERPDYVGFNVRYTQDGVLQVPVYHTTTRGEGWRNTPEANYRDLQQFNPIRREYSIAGDWNDPGGYGEDRRWAGRLRRLGLVKTEVYIDRELYHYRASTTDSSADTAAWSAEGIDIREDFGWVTWL